MIYKRFIVVLLGMFLGTRASAVAQTPAPQIVLTQERFAPTTTMPRTVSMSVPVFSFLLSQGPGESSAHFSRLFAGAYERREASARGISFCNDIRFFPSIDEFQKKHCMTQAVTSFRYCRSTNAFTLPRGFPGDCLK